MRKSWCQTTGSKKKYPGGLGFKAWEPFVVLRAAFSRRCDQLTGGSCYISLSKIATENRRGNGGGVLGPSRCGKQGRSTVSHIRPNTFAHSD